MPKIPGTQRIAGYTYFTTKDMAVRHRKRGESTAFEGGIGWYNYSPEAYRKNVALRVMGWPPKR